MNATDLMTPEQKAALKQKKAEWAQDRLALYALMGNRGLDPTRATKRVQDAGLDVSGGDPYAYLAQLSAKGGVAGKRAKYYTQLLAMNNVEEWGKEAAAGGQDDIARAYQTLTEQFAGSLGANVDMGSPAVLDAVRRYVEGRSADTARYTHEIKGQTMAAKNAILLGQIAPTLDETGALVEALKMLKQEEAGLRRAQYINLGMNAAGLALGAGGLPVIPAMPKSA